MTQSYIEEVGMSKTLKAQFEVTSWDEQPYDEADGVAKTTEATVAKTYTGDIEGTSVTKWLMAYAPDESAVFVGIERIKGSVDGQDGSLVLQHVGAFEDGSARAALTVVSGTGALEGATGDGDFLADPAGSVTLRFTAG
jgi:hypothetical protein